MPVNLHYHQKIVKLTSAGLLVDVDYVVQGDCPCVDAKQIFYQF